jgi:hypothetical protein
MKIIRITAPHHNITKLNHKCLKDYLHGTIRWDLVQMQRELEFSKQERFKEDGEGVVTGSSTAS